MTNFETTTETARTEAHARAAAPPVPTLTVVHHPDRSFLMARVALTRRPQPVGRASAFLGPGALDHSEVSRRHARLTWNGTALRVEDTESRNGTFLNGARVSSALAHPGDVLEIGPVMLLLHLTEAAFSVRRVERWVGRSAVSARLLDQIEVAARHDRPITLFGETGTGKEVVAREIHEASGTRGAFVAVNCAAIPEALIASELFGHERGAFSGANASHAGLFEQAAGGTLLLDEIGDASAGLQVALLRVLQEREVRRLGGSASRPVDARVIAATHRDLQAAVRANTFREDLYARLSAWRLDVPPLRARLEDVPLLVRSFLARLGDTRPLDASAMRALMRCRYDRNVRQLEAAVGRLSLGAREDASVLELTPEVTAMLDTPEAHVEPAAASRALRDDRDGLARLLERHRGNVTHAAKELRIGRNTLYAWLRRLDLPTSSDGHDA